MTDGTVAEVVTDLPVHAVVAAEPAQHVEHIAHARAVGCRGIRMRFNSFPEKLLCTPRQQDG